MAAILGPGGPPVAANIATNGPRDLFWGTVGGMTELNMRLLGSLALRL